jgi:hypothetical protein
MTSIADRICLITPLDRNKTVVDEFGKTQARYYEDEAVRLVKYWRRRGGDLACIPIYAYEFQERKIQERTRDELIQMGTTIVPAMSLGNSGFNLEPYVGSLWEDGDTKEDIAIKVDLDMVLLKPIPDEILEKAVDHVVIGQYDEKSSKTQRTVTNGNLPLDTNFIISSKKSGFYKDYFRKCVDPLTLEGNEYKATREKYGDYFLDEHVVDLMFSEGKFKFLPVQYYQYGDGYPHISEYTDEEVRKMFFLHRHYAPGKNMYTPDEIKRLLAANRG